MKKVLVAAHLAAGGLWAWLTGDMGVPIIMTIGLGFVLAAMEEAGCLLK